MLGRTHIALGLAGTTMMITINPKTAPITLTAAAIASLLPDIDDDNSFLNRKINFGFKPLGAVVFTALLFSLGYLKVVPFISILVLEVAILLSIFSRHRTFSHSLLGMFVYSTGIYLAYKSVFVPFVIGYGLHLIADMFTNSGIELLYPYRKRIGIGLISTGSIWDNMIMIFGFLAFMSRYSMHL
ncbi:metal-dependent hydrolase [Caldanaerobacter subterraneus]|uniref:Metal-dependent hydrolase n=1 Tax=Caldanaerobacter subterraneus TaxID=911092 RepID=A0A7Y2L993_9THEO|nr:metal-dependent hydrolase [Caldanaerobacter subterraneus]NNG67552.1 metal-dependent hydrolase [Caldanaerobacter subterraneus]